MRAGTRRDRRGGHRAAARGRAQRAGRAQDAPARRRRARLRARAARDRPAAVARGRPARAGTVRPGARDLLDRGGRRSAPARDRRARDRADRRRRAGRRSATAICTSTCSGSWRSVRGGSIQARGAAAARRGRRTASAAPTRTTRASSRSTPTPIRSATRPRCSPPARGRRGARRDTEAALHLGPAALVVGAFDLGLTFLTAAVDGLPRRGRLGYLRACSRCSACRGAPRRLGHRDPGRRRVAPPGDRARRAAVGGRSRHRQLDHRRHARRRRGRRGRPPGPSVSPRRRRELPGRDGPVRASPRRARRGPARRRLRDRAAPVDPRDPPITRCSPAG